MLASYVDHAGGGTLTDVDGREWIDFGSGIAVTSVGNAAPRVVEAVRAQVERFTHTCFMVAPYESLRGGVRAAQLAHAGQPRQAIRTVQLGCRGGRERREDRPVRDRAAGHRGVRPRLPRSYEPHDGADGQEHAVQAQVRTVRRRDLPRTDVVPAARRRPVGPGRRGPRNRPDRQAGRRRQRRRRADRTDTGRGRLRRARPRLPAGAVGLGRLRTARC